MNTVSATGDVGQITFNWTAPNSANYLGSRIYWNTSNSMTGLLWGYRVWCAKCGRQSRRHRISAGTRYGFIVAINGSGVAAAAVPIGAVTVT
ncbi:hypothetical protein ABIB57_004816 [Devosia sp. UYZn731]|uniref:hypothetical protein n=1 Tax=Devosia sp. UYZn731 TaxID=3156345 RepID=UPI00339A2C5D